MRALRQIRADYDATSIVVYQAYADAIAKPAVSAQRFIAPFSMHRMTWIKPSFLWLMHRSNWGRKAGQERTLAVRITREGWEDALSLAVLTSPEPKIHGSSAQWSDAFESAIVHAQWDTERSIRGAALDHYSIQIGLSRHIIERFVARWTLSITDLTPIVDKMRRLLDQGEIEKAKRLLPAEKVYTPSTEATRRLGADR